jgi:hypothetical protein
MAEQMIQLAQILNINLNGFQEDKKPMKSDLLGLILHIELYMQLMVLMEKMVNL